MFQKHRHRTCLRILPWDWRMERRGTPPHALTHCHVFVSHISGLHQWKWVSICDSREGPETAERDSRSWMVPWQVHGTVQPLVCWNQMDGGCVALHHTPCLPTVMRAWQWRGREYEDMWYIFEEESSVPDTRRWKRKIWKIICSFMGHFHLWLP